MDLTAWDFIMPGWTLPDLVPAAQCSRFRLSTTNRSPARPSLE